ncbi:glycosyltransferase family 4 protein [Limnobacter alexandrii]|uniref:glycosyltransferase family 4 protein n=1 Tax=Limnobacter alexandrii TaxID=2570352 RepID=UPI001108FEFF|nr:glycosyltransferase family 4 protein [Limnobacter alexandrii]
MKETENKKTTDVLFITRKSGVGTEWKLAKEIYEINSTRMRLFEYDSNLLETIKEIQKNNIILFHQPAIYSTALIIISKIMRKKCACLIWDSYPVIINKKRYDERLIRKIADAVENSLIALFNIKIVPTHDFLARYPDAKKKYFFPIIKKKIKKHTRKIQDVTHIRILFAGQINATRDLLGSYQELSQKLETSFELIICSKDKPSEQLLISPNVQYLGHLNDSELRRLADTCHFGLVSMNLSFAGPGLPSKTFEYIKQGLPILYYGPHLQSYIEAIEKSEIGIIITEHLILENTYIKKYQNITSEKISIFESTLKKNDEKSIDYI